MIEAALLDAEMVGIDDYVIVYGVQNVGLEVSLDKLTAAVVKTGHLLPGHPPR